MIAVDADACGELVLPTTITITDIGSTGGLNTLCCRRFIICRPITAHEHTTILVVEIVQIGIQRQLVHASPPTGRHSQPITVFGSCANLDISIGTDGILFLQFDIHHVTLVVHVTTSHLCEFALTVEHFDLVHRIGRQVLECRLRIALEEVASINQQVVNLLAVHLDLTVFVQFGSRQLTYQRVEHRTFSQIKGIGIIDDGVATHHHLDFRTRDSNFAKHHRLPFHFYATHIHIALTLVLHLEGGILRLEANARGADEVLTLLLDRQHEVAEAVQQQRVAAHGPISLYHCAVGCRQQADRHIGYHLVGERFDDATRHDTFVIVLGSDMARRTYQRKDKQKQDIWSIHTIVLLLYTQKLPLLLHFVGDFNIF